MLLIRQLVKKKFDDFVTAQRKNEVNIDHIWNFYSAFCMSCVAKGEKIPNEDKINDLWNIYIQRQQLAPKVKSYFLSRIMNTDISVVMDFLREDEQTTLEAQRDTNFNRKGVVAIASYYYED